MKHIFLGLGALLFIAGCGQSVRPTTLPVQTDQATTTASAPTSTVASGHTIDEYINTIFPTQKASQQFKQNEMVQMFKVINTSPCYPESDDFCDPDTKISSVDYIFWSDKNWKDGKNHVFYVEEQVEGPSYYYGPFEDNTKRLFEESRR